MLTGNEWLTYFDKMGDADDGYESSGAVLRVDSKSGLDMVV